MILDNLFNFTSSYGFYQESLAMKLVDQGKIRIKSKDKLNFEIVKYPNSKEFLTFTYTEISNENSSYIIKEKIYNLFSKELNGKLLYLKVEKEYNRLIRKLKYFNKYSNYLEELELARILIQSSEHIIMELLSIEEIEIFIVYDKSVESLNKCLDMASVDKNAFVAHTSLIRKNRIIIVIGGNPVGNDYYKKRLLRIAAHEFGHFAYKFISYLGIKNRLIPLSVNEDVLKAKIIDIRFINDFIDFINNNLKIIQEIDNLNYYNNIIHTLKGYIIKYKFIHPHKERNYNETEWLNIINNMLYKFKFTLNRPLYNYANNYIMGATPQDFKESIVCVPELVVIWGKDIVKLLIPNLYFQINLIGQLNV